jgi:hypothetical protein
VVSEHKPTNAITINNITDRLPYPSPPLPPSQAIFDSGTTGHYLLLDTACTHKHPERQPLQVVLPNSAIISSTHTAKLPFPQPPTKAIEAHIFPHLRNHALLSISILCDSGCTVTFTKGNVQVQYNNRIVHAFPQAYGASISWCHNRQMQPILHPSKATALQHIHSSLFSPATQTWITAVKNQHFTTWPQFTPKVIAKLLPKSIATTIRHLDQQRKNVRSTKRKPRTTDREDTEGIKDTNPPQAASNNTGFAGLVNLTEPSYKSYSDLTGRFPLHSNQGNLYVLVLYLSDANAILDEPLKNRSKGEQIKAYENLLQRIPTEHQPKVHWMDNEASSSLKQLLKTQYQMQYQLVPLHIHWRNAAERAICTFKNHFVAGLCSTHPNFPPRLWDSLLPQAEITLNLL